MNGTYGSLGPGRLDPAGRDHRQRDRQLAALRTRSGTPARSDQQDACSSAGSDYRGLHRRHLQDEPARDGGLRRPLHATSRMPYHGGRPDGQASIPAPVNPAFGNSPCNGMLYVPGQNPCPGARPRRAAGRAEPLAPAHRSRSWSRRAWASPGTSSAPARRRSAAAWASSTPVSGSAPAWRSGGTRRSPGTRPVTRTLNVQPAARRRRSSVASALRPPGIIPGSRQRATTGSGTWLGPARARAQHGRWSWPTSATRAGDLLGQTNLNEIAGLRTGLAYAQHRRRGAASAQRRSPASATATSRSTTRDRSSIYHAPADRSSVSTLRPRLAAVAGRYTWSKSIADTGLWPTRTARASASATRSTDSTQPGLDRARSAVRPPAHVFSGTMVLGLATLEDKSSIAEEHLRRLGARRASCRRRRAIPTRSSCGAVPGLSGNGQPGGHRVTRATSVRIVVAGRRLPRDRRLQPDAVVQPGGLHDQQPRDRHQRRRRPPHLQRPGLLPRGRAL